MDSRVNLCNFDHKKHFSCDRRQTHVMLKIVTFMSEFSFFMLRRINVHDFYFPTFARDSSSANARSLNEKHFHATLVAWKIYDNFQSARRRDENEKDILLNKFYLNLWCLISSQGGFN